jgi:hypothetical protein
MLLVAVVDERIQAVDACGIDVTAAPAVAAIRPAELDEFLAPERNHAVAAIAGAHIDFGLVEEFHENVRVLLSPPYERRQSSPQALRSGFEPLPDAGVFV